MDVVDRIMAIVEEFESLEKSDFIQDLLIKLGDDECHDILARLEVGAPLFGD